jgi:hypothetical protein
MYKLSKGDLAINRSTYTNEIAGLSKEDLKKNRNKFFSNNETAVPDENIKNVIPVQYNSDGSLKYTFDNIYENKQLVSIAKDYYSNRDNEVYSNKQAVDKFISDRTWNQANTFAMGKEFLYVTGNNITNDQKARLSYLTRYWDELPNFYEEGGRGASGFFANLGVGILDPLNIVGAGAGGIVSKGVLKKAGKEVIKSQVKKGVKKKTIAKEILNSPEQLAELSAKANKEALIKGSASLAAVEGVGFGTIDIANQLVEKEIDLRTRLDPVRTGTIAVSATGLGFFVGVGGGYLSSKVANLRLAKNNNLPTENLKKHSKKQPNNTNKSEGKNSEIGSWTRAGSTVRSNLADQWDFIKVLQEEMTGVRGDVTQLRKLYKSGDFKVDPILQPYFQLRMLASSGTRAHNFIMGGVYLPPSATAKSASFTKGKSLGLHKMLEPLDKTNEVNEFLNYVAAKRMQRIAKRRPKLDKTLPMDKVTRQEYIDFAELDASSYKKKYGKTLNRKNNFVNLLQKYKIFTDELLEYQVASGLISRADATKILRENPFFIPLTRETEKVGLITAAGRQTRKILGIARPGAVKLAKQKQEGDINLYKNLLTYTYQTVLAGDRNRAKLSFYNMINKSAKLNPEKYGNIVELVTENRRVRIENIAVERVVNAYKKSGAKFDPEKDIVSKVGAKRKDQLSNLDSLDVVTFSNTFKASDEATSEFADIVYRNGKAEIYEVKDPNLGEVFTALGDKGADRVSFGFGPRGYFSRYARFASRAITYSPPFVAFNVLRDTLAGSVNSAFGISPKGFKPVYSTGKGFIDAITQTQNYKEALINGMGYSSRSETEQFIPKNIKDLVSQGTVTTSKVLGDANNYYSNVVKKVLTKAGGGWRGYKKVVEAAEYGTRMGEYQLAKAAGFSDMGASFLGREVATDFGMRGSSVTLNMLSRNTMFLNASIQGLYRTGRLFSENPAKAASLIAATVVAPEITLYHFNSQFKEYSQINDQVKQLNFLLPNIDHRESKIQNKLVLDKEVPFIPMPKPYDLGVFGNIITGLVDGMYKKSDGVAKKYVAESISQIVPGMPIPAGFRPFIEMMANKNFYSGSPVLGRYELQRLNELKSRESTREIAKKLSMLATNMTSFIGGEKKGRVKETVINPITVDYLLGAYFTGLMQYPIDIIENFVPREKIKGEKISKRPDEADLSSFKNAASIVTRRFQIASPIKNSEYHKQWQKIINRAKKLKQIDTTQMDLNRRNETFLIGLYGRTMDKLAEGYPAGVEDEVLVFSGISDILVDGEKFLIQSRKDRNTILASNFDGETKRKQIDNLIKIENLYLKSVIDNLASIEQLDYLFDQTYVDRFKEHGIITGLLTIPFFTAEDTFKKNPREK